MEVRWVVYLILGDQVVENVTGNIARGISGGEIVEGADLNSSSLLMLACDWESDKAYCKTSQ